MRDFECRANFEDESDSQRFELERKTYKSEIRIAAPPGTDLVPMMTGNAYGLTVKRAQALNLTCEAQVGCNDINYDIHFRTNTTDKYRVVQNAPDRTKCSNLNEMSRFSKSLIIDRVEYNQSHFQCEINFGTDLKTPSPNYMVFFAGIVCL